MSAVNVVEARLYSCRYANTYSILIAALGLEQAKSLFEVYLVERGVRVDEQAMTVRRKRDGGERPLYVLA